jgi:hypothetical protein
LGAVPQILIDEFLKKERNAPQLIRISRIEESFETTSSLTDDISSNRQRDMISVKPSFAIFGMMGGFLIFALYVFYQFFIGFRAGAIPFVVLLFMIPMPVLFVYFAFFYGTIFRINLNNLGIAIKRKIFTWNLIQDTFIYRKPHRMAWTGRMHARYLVIVTKDNKFHKLNLYLFEISDEKLSTYIEYFKTRNPS